MIQMSSINFQNGDVMKLNELITIISQKTGNFINQSMLAESLGITRQTVRIKNDSQVTVSEIKKIEDFFNITLFSSSDANENITHINYYSDVFASCGSGSIVFSEEKTKITISTLLIEDFSKQKEYSIINASGNSMSPTIDNGDKLIVRIPTISLDDEERNSLVYGATIYVTFEGKVMHFFDEESEKNLLV